MPRGGALDDASWGGRTDGISLRADHRKGRAIVSTSGHCHLGDPINTICSRTLASSDDGAVFVFAGDVLSTMRDETP